VLEEAKDLQPDNRVLLNKMLPLYEATSNWGRMIDTIHAISELEKSTRRYFVDRPGFTYQLTSYGRPILALPGLRTAIPVACAYANVQPLKFSALNLVSGFAWAGAIMLFVKLGSNTLTAFGLNAWWGPLIPALFVVLFFRWLSLPKRDGNRGDR